MSPSGNNADGKTLTSAWKTLKTAVANLKPGMTVNVMNGVYNEQITITTSGNASAWIVLQVIFLNHILH